MVRHAIPAQDIELYFLDDPNKGYRIPRDPCCFSTLQGLFR